MSNQSILLDVQPCLAYTEYYFIYSVFTNCANASEDLKIFQEIYTVLYSVIMAYDVIVAEKNLYPENFVTLPFLGTNIYL
jgi:hypothetical protein